MRKSGGERVRSSGGLWRSQKDHGAKFVRRCNWGEGVLSCQRVGVSRGRV